MCKKYLVRTKTASYKARTATKRVSVMILSTILLFLFCDFALAGWWDSGSLSTNLELYYPMNENTGTTIYETSFGYLNLTATGTDWGTDNFGNPSVLFIEQADVLSSVATTDLINFDTKDYTFAWRMNATNISESADTNMVILDYGDAQPFLIKWYSGNIRFIVDAQEFTYRAPIDEWHNFMIIYSNASGTANASLWVDGLYNETMVINTTAFQDTFLNWSENDADFTGEMNQWAFWNTSLSDSQALLWNTSIGAFTVSLSSPADNIIVTDPNITFNCSSSTSGVYIDNLTLTIDDLDNYTLDVTDQSEASLEFRVASIASGTHNWSCRAANTENTQEWGTARDFEIGGYALKNQTFNGSTYETQRETIYVNITYDKDVYNSVSTSLIYNGTSYLGSIATQSGENVVFKREIDVPTITVDPTNFSFYWEIVLSNATGSFYENTTLQNQTANLLNLTLCGALSAEEFVNFSIYNETDRTEANASMDLTLFYWLGNGESKKNYSFDSSTHSHNYSLCSNQNNTLNITATINLEDLEGLGYTERTYSLFRQSYNNETTHFPLFLQDGSGSNIIIQVQDSGLQPLEGYYVDIERYYPSDGGYEIIERQVTDIYGQFVSQLVENTIKYRFIFKNESGSVVKTTGDLTIACRATICVLPFVIEDTGDDFDRFENVTDYDWSFSFNNITNVFTFIWNDISGVSATNRIEVKRRLWNGTTIVCNNTSTATSGTLTCDVGSQKASYQAQVFRRVGSGSERRIAAISASVGTDWRTFGREGLIWSFFLLMTMIAVGYWKPIIGIGLYLIGIIILGGMLPIIYVNAYILFAEFAIGIVFIWAFKKGGPS